MLCNHFIVKIRSLCTTPFLLLTLTIHSIGIISNYITILSSTSCLNSCSSSSSLLSSYVRNYSSSYSLSSSPSSSSLYGREEETQQHCQAYKEDKAASHFLFFPPGFPRELSPC